jgi:hypothetical protein
MHPGTRCVFLTCRNASCYKATVSTINMYTPRNFATANRNFAVAHCVGMLSIAGGIAYIGWGIQSAGRSIGRGLEDGAAALGQGIEGGLVHFGSGANTRHAARSGRNGRDTIDW